MLETRTIGWLVADSFLEESKLTCYVKLLNLQSITFYRTCPTQGVEEKSLVFRGYYSQISGFVAISFKAAAFAAFAAVALQLKTQNF